MCWVFFFNDTATTEIYTLSLHDALPIYWAAPDPREGELAAVPGVHGAEHLRQRLARRRDAASLDGRQRVGRVVAQRRSEEHTSELQSRQYLVCRLLLEKKTNKQWRLRP